MTMRSMSHQPLLTREMKNHVLRMSINLITTGETGSRWSAFCSPGNTRLLRFYCMSLLMPQNVFKS